MPAAGKRRAELLDRLMQDAPRLVADALTFHTAVAERLGLTLTDLRYLQAITQDGPATAGDIAHRTGLTTGAVTRMVDRLESAGYVKRTRDATDRRRVVVVANRDAMARVGSVYEGVAAAWYEMLAEYNDAELEIVVDLVQRMRELSRQQAERLS